MNLVPLLTALALSAACAAAGAAETVTVLGIPLGGKLKMPIRQCSLAELGTDVRSLCWVDRPNRLLGGYLWGSLKVPGSDQRPRWAAGGAYRATIKKDGTLSSFDASTSQSDDFAEISKSISGRFGRPQRESKPGARIRSAEWARPEAQIQLLCSWDIGCTAKFTSAATRAANELELAARAAKEATRPLAP